MEIEAIADDLNGDALTWDDAKYSKLIQLVFRCQCVWNTKRVDYRNRQKKANAWRAIGHELNVSDREALGKFKYLRNKFHIEKSKLFNLPTSEGQVPVSSWPHFDEMMQFYDPERLALSATRSSGPSSFLDESLPFKNEETDSVISEFSQYSSAAIIGDEIINSSIVNPDAFTTTITATTSLPVISADKSASRKRTSKQAAFDQLFLDSESATQYLVPEQQTARSSVLEDEFDHFGKIVAAKLRKLPEHLADTAMIDVLKMLNCKIQNGTS